jgi:hypothetical protein
LIAWPTEWLGFAMTAIYERSGHPARGFRRGFGRLSGAETDGKLLPKPQLLNKR